MVHFVDKDQFGCWLGTYYERVPQGYASVQRVRISKELYQSMVTEAHHNAAKYKVKA